MRMPAGPIGLTELDLIIISPLIVSQLVGGSVISPPGRAPLAGRGVAHTCQRPLSECMRPWEWARRHAKERHVCHPPVT